MRPRTPFTNRLRRVIFPSHGARANAADALRVMRESSGRAAAAGEHLDPRRVA